MMIKQDMEKIHNFHEKQRSLFTRTCECMDHEGVENLLNESNRSEWFYENVSM